MNDHYKVVQSRIEAEENCVRYTVEGPGGIIVVDEDAAGNLSGRLRSGYILAGEDQDRVVEEAVRAVRSLSDQLKLEADKYG